MKFQNKFWLEIAALMLAAGVANAQVEKNNAAPVAEEEDEAILFKVHDITPIKALNGDVVTSCDFYVTFYNRSLKDISSAQLDLTWEDNSLTSVIENEKEESAAKKSKGEDVDAGFSYTQKQNPPQLTASVNMPAVKSYKQVTVKQSVKTDRCYMLLDDLAIRVRSCVVKQAPGSSSLSSNNSCNALFSFVSLDNPEYYTGFQEISFDAKKNAEVKERANQEKEMEEQYQQTVRSLDALTQSLSEIK